MPGVYGLAMSCDNITATFFRFVPNVNIFKAYNAQTMTSAYPLPATATWSNPANAYVPWIGAVCSGTVF